MTTNYEHYFGTRERLANTLEIITDKCQNSICEGCFLYGSVDEDSYCLGGDNFFEWLDKEYQE